MASTMFPIPITSDLVWSAAGWIQQSLVKLLNVLHITRQLTQLLSKWKSYPRYNTETFKTTESSYTPGGQAGKTGALAVGKALDNTNVTKEATTSFRETALLVSLRHLQALLVSTHGASAKIPKLTTNNCLARNVFHMHWALAVLTISILSCFTEHLCFFLLISLSNLSLLVVILNSWGCKDVRSFTKVSAEIATWLLLTSWSWCTHPIPWRWSGSQDTAGKLLSCSSGTITHAACPSGAGTLPPCSSGAGTIVASYLEDDLVTGLTVTQPGGSQLGL